MTDRRSQFTLSLGRAKRAAEPTSQPGPESQATHLSRSSAHTLHTASRTPSRLKATHQGESKKPPTKSKRIRTAPDVFGNERLEIKLDDLLRDRDPRLRMYVYRTRDCLKFKPAILVCAPFRGLLDYLRDKQHGGDFALIIRRAKAIELSGVVRIAPPSLRRR